MGFFSSLLGFAAPIVSSFLGVPAAPVAAAPVAAAPAPALLAAPTQLAMIVEPPPALALLAKGRKGGPIVTPEQALALGGKGRLRKRTTVETFDPATGLVVKSKTTPGGVAVFAQDVAAARRINRQVRKLDARLPRKLVKESKIKQLTDRVIKNALEHAGDPHNNGECPK